MGYYPLSLVLGTDPEKTFHTLRSLEHEGILYRNRGLYSKTLIFELINVFGMLRKTNNMFFWHVKEPCAL